MTKLTTIILAIATIASSCNTNSNKGAINESESFVLASLETEPTQSVEGEDAADDPALWYNSVDPQKSLILGTNKRLGLEVYDMKGKRLAIYKTGRLNNVDVRYSFDFNGETIDIAAASNRTTNGIDIWQISEDGAGMKLISDTTHRSLLSEVYGICLYKNSAENSFYAFVNSKEGKIEKWKLLSDSNQISFELITTHQADGQVEGMLADDENDLLFVGEEDGGIFVYPADANESSSPYRIHQSGEENKDLKYDIEGLAMYYLPAGEGYLIASSQGNNRFAVFERKSPHKYLGFFRVKENKNQFVMETDGIEVVNLDLGPGFPNGIFLCQDGFNKDNGKDVPQNFKLVSWTSIAKTFDPELKSNPTYQSATMN